ADLGQSVLEDQRWMLAGASEAVDEVVAPALAVVGELRLYRQPAALGKAAGKNPFDLNQEIERVVGIGPHAEKTRGQIERGVQTERGTHIQQCHVPFSPVTAACIRLALGLLIEAPVDAGDFRDPALALAMVQRQNLLVRPMKVIRHIRYLLVEPL